ncbi:hypothetical protein TRIP_D440210 [uncultured Paludibacter sp.]|nr:hypothetical protein TRIP_D440210 [uncultured Paludibacter sp.]
MKKYIFPFLVTCTCVLIFENKDSDKMSYTSHKTSTYQVVSNAGKNHLCQSTSNAEDNDKNRNIVVAYPR